MVVDALNLGDAIAALSTILPNSNFFRFLVFGWITESTSKKGVGASVASRSEYTDCGKFY